MKKYCVKLVESLDDEIHNISLEVNDPIIQSESAIQVTLQKLCELKEHILEEGFASTEEEISFFKELKPKIVSKLIYYNTVYKIETRKPHGGEKNIKKYLNNELSKLRRYFNNNLEFYKYYRTNSVYLDHKYFVRKSFDIKLCLDTYFFQSDHNFSTSHDYKVAKIIANDLIQVYLEDQLLNVKKLGEVVKSRLTWTDSKTALIELIYALYAHGSFGNGKTDVKEIVKAAEDLFRIDLGDFYHTYLELKNRKINRTKFIDAIRNGLLKKMDDQDNLI